MCRGRLLVVLFRRHVDHLVRRLLQVVLIEFVVTQADDAVLRRLEMDVRNQQDADLVAQLDRLNILALLVEQEGSDIHGHLCMDGRRVVLHGFLFEDAEDVQGRRFGAADVASAGTAWARDVTCLGQGWAETLTGELHQAESADFAGLDARAIQAQAIAHAVFNLALIALVFHVDEVDDDQPAKVAQAQLARNFLGRFEVRLEGGFFDVGTASRAAGVDVDRHQRFRVINDDGAARRQVDLARVRRFDLVFDLEAGKQRHVVAVALDSIDRCRHDMRHELACLFVNVVGVDQDFANVRLEIVADRSNDQAAFLVDQEGALLLVGRAFDGLPELHQVVQIPLQFFCRPTDRRSARNQTHSLRNLQLIHHVAQLGTLVTFHTARYTAAARIVRHQNEVTTSEADKGGQGGTLVTALIFVDLDDQFLAFTQGFLDRSAIGLDARLEVDSGNFLERQEAVTFGAVIHKSGLEARLDARDDGFVDIAFLLFLGG